MVERFRDESRSHPKKGDERPSAPSEVAADATQSDDQDDNADPRGK